LSDQPDNAVFSRKIFSRLNFMGIGFTFLCAVTLISTSLPEARLVPGLLLLCFLPGFAVALFISSQNMFCLFQMIVFGFGVSLALACLEFFFVFYVFKTLSLIWLLFLLCFPAFVLFTVNLLRNRPAAHSLLPQKRLHPLFIFLIFFLAAVLRLTYLGYSDYQGDEAFYCLSNSVRVVQGDMEALIARQKPPTETILTTISYLLFNTYNEFYIRIPLCLTGLFCVLIFFLLARDMFGRFEAVAAGLLAAVNGYFVIFSRIVQYQAVVIFCSLFGILLLYQALQAKDPKISFKLCSWGVFFCAFGVFTHYDGFFVLPAATYLLFQKFKNHKLKTAWPQIVFIFSLFTAITASFYIPFLLHPQFSETANYYQQARFKCLLNFHADILLGLGSVYTPKIYLAFLGLSGLIYILRRPDSRTAVLALWFLFPFFFLMVFCSNPGTHIYNFFIPWCLAASAGLRKLYPSGFTPMNPYAKFYQGCILGLFSSLIAYSGFHIYDRFVKHDPEFLWSPAAKDIPHYGLFGFPYYRGWKTVGYLFRTGELSGVYTSNEKEKITNYYLRQNLEEVPDPDYFIYTWRAQSWRRIRIPQGYRPFANIRVGEKSAMFIYKYSPNAKLAIKNYDAGLYEKLYDQLDMRAP
jgi:hypothetical protein